MMSHSCGCEHAELENKAQMDRDIVPTGEKVALGEIRNIFISSLFLSLEFAAQAR